MQVSDSLVMNIKITAIALMVLSIMIALYRAYYLILAMIEHKRLTYQYLLIVGYFALLCTLISRLFYTLYLDKVSGWFNRVGDFISISCGLLCEIEILRLLVVLVPFLNNRRVFIMEIIAFVFCMITGGFNFFWGFGYLTSKDDNFFGKWSKFGGYVWYMGIALYVVSQSIYMTKLMYQQYSKKKQVNHEMLKNAYRNIIISIGLTLFVILVGMCLMFVGAGIDDGVWKSNRMLLNVNLGGINSCVKATLVYVYQTIFENAKSLCLTNKWQGKVEKKVKKSEEVAKTDKNTGKTTELPRTKQLVECDD